jgi:lysine decarboxylase
MAKERSLTQFLIDHAGEKPVSFHMPGHKGASIYQRFGYQDTIRNMVNMDITEIPGADNLFKSESVIRQTQIKYANIYDVKSSYLLVNGTSGGLIAGILATVPTGSKLIMARNCHKSVFNAVRLAGLEPVFLYPEIVSPYGVTGEVLPEDIARSVKLNPDAKAVVLPSPNYYGICSNMAETAEIVHEAGMVLIVDQAHGAHLKLFEGAFGEGNEKITMPPSAETSGADIIVNSTHKTLASLTQSAVININSDRVSLTAIEDKLQMIESSSPSYILMASLDINADIIGEHGHKLICEWGENIEHFYKEAMKIDGMILMDREDLDKTKLNIDMSSLGISGYELEQLLMDRGIYTEFNTGSILMAMTGIGNTREDYDRLLEALEDIGKTAGASGASRGSEPKEESNSPLQHPEHRSQNNPSQTSSIWTKKRHSFKTEGDKRVLPIDECEGKACGASIIPYPPGIPLICEGETIDREDISYIKELVLRGEKVIGVSEDLEIEAYDIKVYRA